MFSENEKKIIKIIGRKKMYIKEITKKFYGRKLPLDSNNKVGAYIRRIVKKCKHYRLTWTLDGEGLGRRGKLVWRI